MEVDQLKLQPGYLCTLKAWNGEQTLTYSILLKTLLAQGRIWNFTLSDAVNLCTASGVRGARRSHILTGSSRLKKRIYLRYGRQSRAMDAIPNTNYERIVFPQRPGEPGKRRRHGMHKGYSKHGVSMDAKELVTLN
jgi:hypothetical protein